MSQFPLSITGLGMISCLGEGAQINAAAMRCDYDGFQQTGFNQPYSAEKQLGAPIESQLRGVEKLSYMSLVAVTEAIKNLPKDYQGLNVIYCMPEKTRLRFFNTDDALNKIAINTFKNTRINKSSINFIVFWQHRCGFISALKQAQNLLHQQDQEYVLIISLDSLLNNTALAEYGGGLYGEKRRLLGDKHSNGFIPGEAATAVLLSTPETAPSDVIISGVGESTESATLDNENDVLKGKALAQAIKLATQQAKIHVHDTHYRVSSVSGEDYFFKEAALALSKALKQKVPEHQLLHPADNIGEVGSAIGGAMVIMDYFALTQDYAPGNKSLHIISNDNEQRGAYIMQLRNPQ